MAPRPIFCATHPRACSTAFERVFMTRRDELECVHEPFGDAFYYGPEHLSDRFRDDSEGREASGLSKLSYANILSQIERTAKDEGKRVFIKDMAYYLFAPEGRRTKIAPSLGGGKENENPTVIPIERLRKFHFTFLIRHPRRAIPSYYRCTVPPLQEVTGWDTFLPSEAGYEELVRLFNFLIKEGIVTRDNLTVLDADDMLDNPEQMIEEYCRRTGIEFKPEMMKWTEEDKKHAVEHFAKWNGFHEDAIHTEGLQGRLHAKKNLTAESENAEWTEKFGLKAAKLIRRTVDANVPYYEYLKEFCIQP